MFYKFGLATCVVSAASFSVPALAAPASAAQPVAAAPAGTAQPLAAAPDAAKLALASQVAEAVWPNGMYARMMKEMMGGENGMMDAMLDMRPVDLIGEEATKKAAKDGEVPEAAKLTIREAMRAKDPHFEERTRLTMKVMGEEMGKAFAPLEPKMRAGLARAYARRFSTDQLRHVATFFATPAGKSFAAESVMMLTDKELMREMMSGMPAMMRTMPEIMKRVEAATAHLPPPPEEQEEGGEEDAESTSGEIS